MVSVTSEPHNAATGLSFSSCRLLGDMLLVDKGLEKAFGEKPEGASFPHNNEEKGEAGYRKGT